MTKHIPRTSSKQPRSRLPNPLESVWNVILQREAALKPSIRNHYEDPGKRCTIHKIKANRQIELLKSEKLLTMKCTAYNNEPTISPVERNP